MSGTAHLDRLVQWLTEGRPIVLLVGQDAWRSGESPDPVLELATRRLGRESSVPRPPSFPDLLRGDPLPEEFYEWLADVYSTQPEQQWMEPISRLALNAVFTTSVDPAISRTFRASGRDVEPILSKDDTPGTPRDRRILHLTYLFGRAGEGNQSEAPPKSWQDLRRRTAVHATPLLSRIIETTTALGVVIIDGLVCGRDWLDCETLAGVMSALLPGQVYWFGWSEQSDCSAQKALLELGAPGGPINFVPERLSSALRALELANKIDLSEAAYFPADGSISIQDHVLHVDPATRLKVSTSASIVDDGWVVAPQPLGQEAEYVEFRRFHGQVEDPRRFLEGVLRGFAIQRTFETELEMRVQSSLGNAGRIHEPILLHGQSGTGKSVALVRLAAKVRQAKRYPVLLASRVARMPSAEELDDFCLKAEEVGAGATLVICDANQSGARYGELLRQLVSRGRRIVIVGSSYRLVDDQKPKDNGMLPNRVEVPAELDPTETRELSDLISRWTGVDSETVGSRYLLPAIYRFLPEVRPRLADGLAREARVAEDDLRNRGKATSAGPPRSANVLGQALVRAGLANPKQLLEQELESFLGKMSDSATRAIDLVMMPGKLDCPVPINLLMRAVGGSEDLVDVSALFSGIDLFRWSSNEDGDIFVHPRLKLEAELISARRLGTAQTEAAIALRLLINANPTLHEKSERRFVIDFVQKLGPDGPYGRRYANHYLSFARALTEIRSRRGLNDPSLMLQEASLRRRLLRDAVELQGVDQAEVLEEARRIVDLALNEIGPNPGLGLRRARANLKVERAAIYGFMAVERLKSGAPLDEVWQYYEGARDSAKNAVFSADSYPAIDISLWVPSDLLRLGTWETDRRAELISDILDGLERVDISQLDTEFQISFQERRAKAAQAMDDKALNERAIEELERLGSKVGVLLKAREIGGDLSGLGPADQEVQIRAQHVADYMRGHEELVVQDPRSLRYFLRSLWLASTGTYLFGGERSPLPEQSRHLEEIAWVLDSLYSIEGSSGDPRTIYLRAVLMWRLQRENAARELWKTLDMDTSFNDPRRVVRHHLWTELGGTPKLFHGRIVREHVLGQRARVQVEELRQEVDLRQVDFPTLELRRGAVIPGGFYIAFNFIGPIADSPTRSGRRK